MVFDDPLSIPYHCFLVCALALRRCPFVPRELEKPRFFHCSICWSGRARPSCVPPPRRPQTLTPCLHSAFLSSVYMPFFFGTPFLGLHDFFWFFCEGCPQRRIDLPGKFFLRAAYCYSADAAPCLSVICERFSAFYTFCVCFLFCPGSFVRCRNMCGLQIRVASDNFLAKLFPLPSDLNLPYLSLQVPGLFFLDLNEIPLMMVVRAVHLFFQSLFFSFFSEPPTCLC